MPLKPIANAQVSAALTHLLVDHPEFGSLALNLEYVPYSGDAPMCTDGTHVLYNERAIAAWTDRETQFVIAHEALHCAFLHMFRRNGRDLHEWNVACDYAINQLLLDSGLTPPAGLLLDASYRGLSAEDIFAKRAAQQAQQPQQQPTPGNGQPGNGADDVIDAPGDGDETGDADGTTEADWQTATEAAFMATKKAGKLPAELARAVDASRKVETDCWEVLRQFVEATAPTDYSYSRPNRRYVASGLYLPGVTKRNTPPFLIYVDTSGSVTQEMLNQFGQHITHIVNEFEPRCVHVVYCDTQVTHVERFEPGDDIELHAKGGGGTLFQPAFDYVEARRDDTFDEIAAAIYLTDLCSSDTPTEPDYSVLFAVPRYYRNQTQPFGDKVVMN